MMIKALSIGTLLLSLGASAALAEGLTDRMQRERMTVLQVDRTSGKFQCVEHRRWTAAPGADLMTVNAGDIVSLHREDGRIVKLRVARTAAEEMASPER